MRDALFSRLCEPATLQKVWQYVRDDSRDDFVEDVVRYSDYGQHLHDNIRRLSAQLRAGRFYPTSLSSIDVPKTELSTRPGSVPEIEDRIVAHAIVYLLAPRLDRRLSDSVYSFRLKKHYEKADRLFEHYDLHRFKFLKAKTIRRIKIHDEWYQQWPEYDEITRYMYETEGYQHLALTDISAYFENIHHDLLRDRLLRYVPNAIQTIDLLMMILARWNVGKAGNGRVGRGIPQGTEISSFLGNVFLMPLDAFMAQLSRSVNIKYFRYMDDTKIFARSREVAVDAVLGAERVIRSLHLNLQGAKSEILHGPDIKKRLFDGRLDRLNKHMATIEALRNGERKKRRPVLEAMLKPLIPSFRLHPGDNKAIQERLIKRQFTVHRLIGSTRMSRLALTIAAERMEYKLVGSALQYLAKYPDRRRLLKLLAVFEQRSSSAPEYWKAAVIRSLRYYPWIPESFRTGLWRLLRRRRTHWYLKTQITTLLCLYPQSATRLEAIASMVENELEISVRRGLIVMLTQLPSARRNDALRCLSIGLEPGVIRLVRSIESLSRDKTLARDWLRKLKDGSRDEGFFSTHAYVLHLIGRSESFNFEPDRTRKALEKRVRLARRGWLRKLVRQAIGRLPD